MSNPTGTSRRLQQCFERLHMNDFEGALVQLFPAIDKTAKKRRPKEGVGSRIRSFLRDEEILISIVATGNAIRCTIDGVDVADALYKFCRTSIAHEGELDPRLSFNQDGRMRLGFDKWNLPSEYIFGMALSVVIAPENVNEKIDGEICLNLFDKQFMVNDMWGRSDMIRDFICQLFCRSDVFK